MSKLKELREKLNGPVFPIITPFKNNTNNEVDHDALRKYIDFLYDGGARLFYVMTYNARFSLLSWDEMKEVNETTARHIKEKDPSCVVIVADPMTNPTSVSVEFAKHAESIGADIISLIFMERYHHDDQVYKHFKTVADSTNIGILIHEQNLDSIRGQIKYPFELLDRLADIENVIALKEDSKDALFSEQVLEMTKDRVNMIISGRGKRQYIHFNNMGCHAHLVGIGSFLPKVAIDFHNYYNSGKLKECWEIINELERPFFEIGMKYGWHPVLKSGMEIAGIMNRVERPPLCSLSEEQHNAVKSVMYEMKKSKHWSE